jgi:hypothetical protein
MDGPCRYQADACRHSPFCTPAARIGAWVKPFVEPADVNQLMRGAGHLGGGKRDKHSAVRDWHSENITLQKVGWSKAAGIRYVDSQLLRPISDKATHPHDIPGTAHAARVCGGGKDQLVFELT